MKKLSVIVVGAGNRGERYAGFMHQMSDRYTLVGMADPAEARRRHFQQAFGVKPENCYPGWREILSQPKMADIAVIATVDNMHLEPALLAIEKGYDLLLEKPVAQTAAQCAQIAAAAREKGVKVLVCHVLRYTPFYGKLKELLMSGIIGKVMAIDQVEGIGNVHFSHSYVRGNWHSEAESTPMLLAKSCHDLDIIQWLVDEPCLRVSSFGELTHFTAENAPEGAPQSCVDGDCPHRATCPYDVIRHYYDFKTNHRRSIITKGIAKSYEPTDEEVMIALRTTDYGLCAYRAHNDVVDHQVVNMQFAGGATATLNVNAFNKGGRYTRIYGTKGEMYAHMKDKEITVFTFGDKKTFTVPVLEVDETIVGGHGGGDEGIVRELYEYFSGSYTGYRAADIEVSVKNHLIGFAAEEARRTNTVVDVAQTLRSYGF